MTVIELDEQKLERLKRMADTMVDPVEALERALAEGEDIWEGAIDAGTDARESTDQMRWRIGDLARLVTKAYGKNRIEDFADGIGEAPGTVKEYRTVCGFWTKSARADYCKLPGITYTHMRLAVRLKDFERAVEFIEDCAMGEWSSGRAEVELKKRLGQEPTPAKLLDVDAHVYDVAYAQDGETAYLRFVLAPGVDPRALEDLHQGRAVRLVLKPVEGE